MSARTAASMMSSSEGAKDDEGLVSHVYIFGVSKSQAEQLVVLRVHRGPLAAHLRSRMFYLAPVYFDSLCAEFITHDHPFSIDKGLRNSRVSIG